MQSVIDRFEELLKQDDFREIRNRVGVLRSEFRKKLEDKNDELREAFIDEGGDPDAFEAPVDPLEEKLEALFVIYNEKKEAFKLEREAAAAQRAERERQRKEANIQKLEVQKGLLEELKVVVSSGETNGEALQKIRDLQNKWKANGKIDPEEMPSAKDVQLDFSHQLDVFFHNRKINLELRDLDQNRNLEAKRKILKEMEALIGEEAIDKVAASMRKHQSDWNAAGQVPWDKKDEIFEQFKTLADQIYGRIQSYYDERRASAKQNLEAKQGLLDQVKAINIEELKSHKSWQENTSKVIALQADWKKIGFSERNEEIWQEFRSTCDGFFASKKHFYENLDANREQNRLKKIELCEKAEQMQDNTDWKSTTEFFIRLQKEWKGVGSAQRNVENELWNRFRSACDAFFQSKKGFFGQLDEQQDKNLELKEALIAKINATELSGEGGKDVQMLRAFASEWDAIGHVPLKEKDRIYNAYYKAIDAKYDKLKMDREERVTMQYKSRLDNLMASADAEGKIRRERQNINTRIDKLRQELNQYENNLGFFAKSRGDNPLKKEVESKIEKIRKEIQDLRNKLKTISTAAKKKEEAVAAPVEEEKVEE